MKTNLTIMFIFFLFSCGGDSVTNPPIIDFHTDDQNFINDLASVNSMLDTEAIENGITKIEVDTEGVKFFKIKKLYMGSMNLDSIPSSIGDLDSLTILMLNNNKFKFIPESICSIFENLDSLAVDNNEICTPDLPNCIKNITTITFYDSQDCDYQHSNDDEQFIDRMIDENTSESEGWADLSNDSYEKYFHSPYTKWLLKFKEDDDSLEFRIVEIDWDNIGITKLPEAISNLTELTYLDIAGNNLTNLPSGIKDLSNLVKLIVYENSLSNFPSGIGNLSKLEVLEAYNNQLNELPNTIGNLNSLLKLRVQNNLLGVLPSELCDLIPQLTSFNVACNQLIIDDEVEQCPALEGKLDDQGDHPSCDD